MEFKRILLDRPLFAADTQDLNIPADHVKYLDLGIYCHACGATACTAATLALSPIDQIRVNLGGEWIANIHFADLIALNMVWENILPYLMVAAATTNTHCMFTGVRLPLHVSKCGKSLSTVITYLANAAIDPCNLMVAYQYREKPFASHFNYQYKEQLATTTWREINMDYAGAECIGILLFGTTLSVTAAGVLTRTIGHVKLLVDDREVYNEDWDTMTTLNSAATNLTDDAQMGGVFGEHYRWIDLQQEPLPAGKLRMLAQSDVSTDTFRIIPVYIQANKPA